MQPTLSSTSAVAGSDRAESTLGSRPPVPRAVDRSTALAAPTHARRQGMQPGIRAAPERSGAQPARPPQFPSRPSSHTALTAATADGSSRADDPVDQGTSYLSFPLSAAAEDDDMSYTRRAMDSSTEGGARVHPPIVTHPRGMEGVRRESRTSPAAYWPGDSRFAFKPTTATDGAYTGERRAGSPKAPVAHPRYHTLAERDAHVDILPASRRVYVTATTSRTGIPASSTVTMYTSSEQEGDAPVCLSGTPQGQLHDTAGRDLKSRARRALYSATEGGARAHPSSTHQRGRRGVEGVLPHSYTPPSVANSRTLGQFYQSRQPVSLADDFRAGPSPPRRLRYSPAWSPSLAHAVERIGQSSCNATSTAVPSRALPGQEAYSLVRRGSLTHDVASVAERVGASLRTVYDISTKYISHFSFDVVSIATRTFPVSPSASPDAERQRGHAPDSPPTPWTAPILYTVDVPGVYAGADTWTEVFDGLPPSPDNVGLHVTSMFPSVAAVAPYEDGRSNPRGCDTSDQFQSSPPRAATNNHIKSTSQRTPALEGGAGVLQPNSHPQAMEGTSAEEVLPAYAETSAPGKDSRFALESRMPYTTAQAPSEKHPGPKDKSAFLNAATEQWAHNVSPIAVHMFSRAAENPAARAVLQSVQGGSQRIGSTPQPPEVTQPAAARNASGRAGRARSSAQADGRDDESTSSKGLDASRYERRARALRNVKLPMPTYNGCADLQVYEAFVFKWDSWIRNRGLGEKDSVELMYNTLTGEALEWYLSFVAMGDYAWTSREIYQELYEYCFPSNFREELRLKLMTSRQDGRPVKRFAKDLQNLAIRFSDVGQSTLKHLLWDGVDPYIRVFWVEKGRSAEYDDYDTLVLYAHRAERREAEIRRCLDSEGADVETELSPHRDYNPDRRVTVNAVRMRQAGSGSQEQTVPMEYEDPEYSEDEQEYFFEEEPGQGNGEEAPEEDREVEGEYSQQYNDEYGAEEDEDYHSQDESESSEHVSQDSQGEYYEDEYEEYGEAEHQPDEYGDEDYPYLEGHEERNGEGEDYYDEEGEEEVDYYEDEPGDEDEDNGHNGEPPLNTGRNEYGEDEYESEGSLYED